MKNFFDTKENKQLLIVELKKWTGTHFQYSTAGKAEPGIVADCVSFPINVYKRLGLISKDYTTPIYSSRPSNSCQLDTIFNDMDNRFQGMVKIWKRENENLDINIVEVGDVIVCSFHKGIQHLLISSGDGLVWDCWPYAGVRSVPLCTSKITRNAQRVYRWIINE